MDGRTASLRAALMGEALRLRHDLATGPLTRDDLARRFVDHGLSFRVAREAIDTALDTASAPEPNESSAVVEVGSTRLRVATVNQRRVITLAMMDAAHQRPEGTAGRNFREHEDKLVEGEDFFRLGADEIRRRRIVELSPLARGEIVLLAESGYLLLVKSFTDPLAWQVQRRLMAAYFRQADGNAQGGALAPAQVTARTIGGIIKAVTGSRIAASENRILAHVEAMMDGLERRLALRLASGSGHVGHTSVPTSEPGATHIAPAEDGAPASPEVMLTALAVVRQVVPGATNLRVLAQVASAGLRKAAREMRMPPETTIGPRLIFKQAVAAAWLGNGGKDRLLRAAR